MTIVVFSFGNMRRSRYLTVAYPLVACAMAGAIHSLAAGRAAQRRVAQASVAIGFLLALGGLLVLISGFWIGPGWGAGGVLLLGLGAAGVMTARSGPAFGRWSWIGAVFLVGFVAHGACFRPVLSPSPLPKLTLELQTLKPGPSTIYVHEVQPRVPGIIRILSGGKLKVQTITSIPVEGAGAFPSPIVSTNPEALRKANYSLVRIEPDSSPPPAARLDRTTHSRGFWIGLRSPTPGAH